MNRFISLAFLTLCLTAAALAAGESRMSGLIGAGTRWETAYHVIEAAEPGPTVVLVGGVHGDEPAGAGAAEQIRYWPILKGRLVVIPRANTNALNARTRFIPDTAKDIHDLNRDFPKPEENNEPSGELATALWNFVTVQKPDWLIDLHEGYGFHQKESGSVGSSIIDSNGDAADVIAPEMLAAVNAGIPEAERRFVNLSPPVSGSLARAAAAHLGAETMILETTNRDQCLSQRIRQHRTMVREFLVRMGMMAADRTAGMLVTASPSGPRVAVFDDQGVGDGGPENIEATLRGVPDSLVWRVGAEDIREGALQGFDLVVFPGGSGGKEGEALGKEGRDAVRRFVDAGGGYAGICAGAYLAAANYPWSLAISKHRTFCESREIPGAGLKSMWFRGDSAMVTMELSDAGRQILGDRRDVIPVRYHNGPVMLPADSEGLPDYEVLAWFRSEVVRYEPQRGTMTATPAIISSRFGKGRVLCVSPHPEATKGLRPLLAKGLQWAAGR